MICMYVLCMYNTLYYFQMVTLVSMENVIIVNLRSWHVQMVT